MTTEIALTDLLGEDQKRKDTRKLKRLYARTWEDRLSQDVDEWGPYPKQVEFHALGADHPERMLMAGNQVGKSRSCAAEIAMHLTGWYPPWWTGYRCNKHIDVLACGTTNEATRDICQKSLLGEIVEAGSERVPDGTGWIPGDAFGKCTFRQCGLSNVVDTCKVAHVSGKYSTLKFKSYQQGFTSFQGDQYNIVWPDEEPEDTIDQRPIFGEIQRSLMVRRGLILCSRTPTFGKTAFITHFMDGGPGIALVNMTLYDAKHISDADRESRIARYPPHERECRVYGTPMMGQGRVFNIEETSFVIDPVRLSPHWARICGIDFGLDHYGAASWLAWDRDSDTVYLYDGYKQKNWTAGLHSIAIRKRGDWIPVAWPHDGLNREKSSGAVLVEQYDLPGRLGLSARYDDQKGGGQDTEPIVAEVIERIQTGRFKVFRTMTHWLEEFRMYHRKEGRLVKANDDALASSFYGLMMLRYAMAESSSNTARQSTASYAHDPLSRFIRSR